MTKIFRVNGTFKAQHHTQPFSIELVAADDKRARELILTRIGSKHAVPRRLIKLDKCVEVPADQVQSVAVRHQSTMK